MTQLFYRIGAKTRKQMGKRGWPEELIRDTLNNPEQIIMTRDNRYRPNGTKVDEPATIYIRFDGSYVVRNDASGDIVQISDRNNSDWQTPF